MPNKVFIKKFRLYIAPLRWDGLYLATPPRAKNETQNKNNLVSWFQSKPGLNSSINSRKLSLPPLIPNPTIYTADCPT